MQSCIRVTGRPPGAPVMARTVLPIGSVTARLKNVVERGVALAKGSSLEVAHLPEDLRRMRLKVFRRGGERMPSLDDQEKAYIQWVLQEVDGNRSRASAILGIDRVSLWRKLKRYGIAEP